MHFHEVVAFFSRFHGYQRLDVRGDFTDVLRIYIVGVLNLEWCMSLMINVHHWLNVQAGSDFLPSIC